MRRTPDFDELVGGAVAPEERERLRRVHELLVAAGPPPDLPATLAAPPQPGARAVPFPRRRRALVLLAAALAASAAFAAGYAARGGEEGFEAVRELPLRGTSAEPQAVGMIRLGERDEGGNWPMELEVEGLDRLPPRGYYEVWLTRNGKRIGPCGSFDIAEGRTTVYLNAPYEVRPGDGWIVVVHRGEHEEHAPVVMSTT